MCIWIALAWAMNSDVRCSFIKKKEKKKKKD